MREIKNNNFIHKQNDLKNNYIKNNENQIFHLKYDPIYLIMINIVSFIRLFFVHNPSIPYDLTCMLVDNTLLIGGIICTTIFLKEYSVLKNDELNVKKISKKQKLTIIINFILFWIIIVISIILTSIQIIFNGVV